VTDGVTAPALRQRSAPQMFDAVFALARRNAWDLFVLGVLFHLPVHLFRIAGSFAGPGSFLAQLNPEEHIGTVWWSLWNTLAVAATATAACQVYADGSTSVRRVLDAMRAGGWKLLGTIAAYAIVVDGLFTLASGDAMGFAIALVFILVLVWVAPAIPVGVVEHAEPWTAMRRAVWLAQGNYWRVAVVVWVVWAATFFADGTLVNFSSEILHRAPVPRIVDVVVDGVLYPLRGLVIAVAYFDCRIRREAYDLERLMQAG
jgi:hypothetical protein